MSGMGNGQSGSAGNGVQWGPNSVNYGFATDKIGLYGGAGLSDGQVDSVLFGASIGNFGGGVSYDGENAGAFFDAHVVSGSYDPRTGAWEGGGGTPALTGRVGYDGDGTGYVAADLLTYEVARVNWTENPEYMPDAQYERQLQDYLQAHTEEMRARAIGPDRYERDIDAVSERLGRPDASRGGDPGDFPEYPERGPRYDTDVEWFNDFGDVDREPVTSSDLVPSSVGIAGDGLAQVKATQRFLDEEYGEQLSDEQIDAILDASPPSRGTDPEENFGGREALDGSGTDWSYDQGTASIGSEAGPDDVAMDDAAREGGSAPTGGETYTIAPGDTLSAIAARAGTSVEALAAANGIEDLDRIQAGSGLTIPTSSDAGAAEADASVPGAGTANDAEQTYADFRAAEAASYGGTDAGARDDAGPGNGDSDGPDEEGRPTASDGDKESGATIAPDEAVLGPEPEYSMGEHAAAAGGAQLIGSMLEDEIGLDNLAEEFVFDSVNDAFQSNVSAAFDDSAGTVGFEDFGDDLGASAAGVGTAIAAAELGEELGFDGESFGDQLGNVVTQQALNAGVDAVAGTTLSSGSNVFTSGFSGANIASLGAGLVTSALTEEMGLGAETQTGAVLSSVGSTVGAIVGSVIPVVGTYIGSFIGSMLGSMIGDMIGGGSEPPPPEAEATIEVGADGELAVTEADGAHGGNGGSMMMAIQSAADSVNGVVDSIGGRFLEPEALGEMTLGYDELGLYANGQRVDSVAEGIDVIIRDALEATPIAGGDVYAKRALYQHLESGELDMIALNEALETAKRYSALEDQAGHIERRSGNAEALQQFAAVANRAAANDSAIADERAA